MGLVMMLGYVQKGGSVLGSRGGPGLCLLLWAADWMLQSKGGGGGGGMSREERPSAAGPGLLLRPIELLGFRVNE